MTSGGRYRVGHMGQMSIIGLAVVVLGAAGVSLMLFGQRTNPLPDPNPDTLPAGAPASTSTTRGATAVATPPGADRSALPSGGLPPVGNAGGVHLRWYQRLRSFALLAVIIVGIGTAVGAVIGAAILAFSVILS